MATIVKVLFIFFPLDWLKSTTYFRKQYCTCELRIAKLSLFTTLISSIS